MTLTEEGLLKVDGLLSRWVRLPSGVQAHYVTAGETGPAVVLLHGGINGSSGTAGFRFMAPMLAAHGFRVYCPDLPAYGLTRDPDGFYQQVIGGHVDFIHDVTTALCLDRFHLGGNSMGCINTVYYVVSHPERVISYALISGVIGDLVSPAEAAAVRQKVGHRAPAMFRFDGTAASMRSVMTELIHRDEAISDDLVEMRTRAANLHTEEHARHISLAYGEQSDVDRARLTTTGRLDRLPIPAIYLFGRQDVALPVELGHLQEDRLPNVQFFYPDDCGHQGQTDQPEMFNQVFLEFFRDGQVSRATADWAGVSARRPENAQFVAKE